MPVIENTIELVGDKKLQKQLEMLKDSVVRQVMKPAYSKALTPINKEAKRLANQNFNSKTISKMIGKKVSVSKRGKGLVGKVYVRPDKTGRTIDIEGRQAPFEVVANIQEFGKKDGSLPARPFMRPAMESKKTAAMAIVKEEAKKNLDKVVKKSKRLGKKITK